jgi:hypothetical protein
LELELLFEINAEIAPRILIPDTLDGTRVIVHVTGGKFEGPRLKGTVLASGADCATGLTAISTAPLFAASTKGKYAWLNGVQGFAEGETTPGGVRYKVYIRK